MGKRSYSVNEPMSPSTREDSLHRSFLCAVLVILAICLILLLVSMKCIGDENKLKENSERNFEALLREKQQEVKHLENTSLTLVDRILQSIISEQIEKSTEKILDKVTHQSTVKEIIEDEATSTEKNTEVFITSNKGFISTSEEIVIQPSTIRDSTVSSVNDISSRSTLFDVTSEKIERWTSSQVVKVATFSNSDQVLSTTEVYDSSDDTSTTFTLFELAENVTDLEISTFSTSDKDLSNTEIYNSSDVSSPRSTRFELDQIVTDAIEIVTGNTGPLEETRTFSNLDKDFFTREVYNNSDATSTRSTIFESNQTIIENGTSSPFSTTFSNLDKDLSSTEAYNSSHISEQTTETIWSNTSEDSTQTTIEELRKTNFPLFSITEVTNLESVSSLRNSDENSESTTYKLEETTTLVTAITTVPPESNDNNNGLIESDFQFAKFTPEDVDTSTTIVVNTTDATEIDQRVSMTADGLNQTTGNFLDTTTNILESNKEVITRNNKTTSATLTTITNIITPFSESVDNKKLSTNEDATTLLNTTDSGPWLSMTTTEISPVSNPLTAEYIETSSTMLVTVPSSSERVNSDRLSTSEAMISTISSIAEESKMEVTTLSKSTESGSTHDDEYYMYLGDSSID